MEEIIRDIELKPIVNQFVNDDYKTESSLMRGRYLGDSLRDNEDYKKLRKNMRKAFGVQE